MQKTRQPDESGTGEKKCRILVVEDEAIIAEDIEQSLDRLGYEVVAIVVTGNEALEKAGSGSPDLVLMDIMLAGNMDGIEAAYRIQSLYNIPVIYLTAFSDESILKRAGGTASYGYLLKPFSERELYTTIETAINKHRMEEKLRESEARFREVVEGTGDLITRTDGQGNFLYVNHMAEKVLGLDTDDCIGQSALQFIHPDDRHETETWLGECVRKKLPMSSIENRQVNKKTGDVHHMSWTSNFYYDKNGQVARINGIARDITARKKAEEERERLNRDLEEKNKELERIIYVTSHDLRSPMVNISGYCKDMAAYARELKAVVQKNNVPEDVMEEVDCIVNENMTESVKYINAGLVKMESLLNGLLKLSRTGTVELEKEKLDIAEMVSHIADAIEFQTREAGAGIHIADLPPCFGDRDQIDQVFSNLIGNALKYLQPGRKGIITVSGKQEGDHVVYCVEDNGIGIAPENQERIFGIFQQVDTKHPGDGLGLAIVKKITERHDGSIWLESEPGKGSRFFVSLPSSNSSCMSF